MADHTKSHAVDIDPAELARAQEMWHNFTVFSKKGIIATAVLLILMALTLVKFS